MCRDSVVRHHHVPTHRRITVNEKGKGFRVTKTKSCMLNLWEIREAGEMLHERNKPSREKSIRKIHTSAADSGGSIDAVLARMRYGR